jgi:hypothetical protein
VTPSRSYATAGAFRRALEERLKGISQAEQVDLNRLRRQVSFDRLLARLFRNDAAPRVLKGGYALTALYEQPKAANQPRKFGKCFRKEQVYRSTIGLSF